MRAEREVRELGRRHWTGPGAEESQAAGVGLPGLKELVGRGGERSGRGKGGLDRVCWASWVGFGFSSFSGFPSLFYFLSFFKLTQTI